MSQVSYVILKCFDNKRTFYPYKIDLEALKADVEQDYDAYRYERSLFSLRTDSHWQGTEETWH